jgi:glycosyltransferase involved in cell wall biosynthesis
VSNKFLSIIIPAYNEEKRLALTLEKIVEFLSTKTYSSEVLVVDDGSTDDTLAVANGYIEKFGNKGISLRIVKNPNNCGKGYTIRNGILQALGEIAIFTDADLSTPITELDKLISPIINREKDIVFGSRALPDSEITTHQPTTREIAGRIFNQIMKIVTGLNFQDTQCGFKAFNRNKTSWIFEKQKIFGFGFDVEVLFVAQKHGLKCLELPVIWADVDGTKVSTFKGILAFLELILIRWYYLLGYYTPSTEVTCILREEGQTQSSAPTKTH